ncbi:hypothetical protein V8B97DRAFT_2003477 [Scleroderma yunnanense]
MLVMGVLPVTQQRTTKRPPLQARADQTSDISNKTGWGTIQIVTPIVVGAGLILCFAAYIVWTRRHRSSLNARPTRIDELGDWFVSKFDRVFSYPGRHIRHRVTHSSGLVTLDDSMESPCVRIDLQHRARQYSADSTDSSTPLTRSTQSDDSPLKAVQSAAQNRKSRRWSRQFFQLIGLGPREVKSSFPPENWRIEDSSTGHGQDPNERENRDRLGYAKNGGLEGDHEDDPFDEDRVIAIGNENFSSIASTNERGGFAEPHSAPAPTNHLPSKLGSTTPLAVPHRLIIGSALQSDLPPPIYKPATDITAQRHHQQQHHVRQPSIEDSTCPADASTLFPSSVRAAGYGSPFRLHDHKMSSDSLLASHTPMALPAMH